MLVKSRLVGGVILANKPHVLSSANDTDHTWNAGLFVDRTSPDLDAYQSCLAYVVSCCFEHKSCVAGPASASLAIVFSAAAEIVYEHPAVPSKGVQSAYLTGSNDLIRSQARASWCPNAQADPSRRACWCR